MVIIGNLAPSQCHTDSNWETNKALHAGPACRLCDSKGESKFNESPADFTKGKTGAASSPAETDVDVRDVGQTGN